MWEIFIENDDNEKIRLFEYMKTHATYHFLNPKRYYGSEEEALEWIRKNGESGRQYYTLKTGN